MLFSELYSLFFFSSRRRHTRYPLVTGSSDVCSSDLGLPPASRPSRPDSRDAAQTPSRRKIGRASCREKEEISGGAVSLKKKKEKQTTSCRERYSVEFEAERAGSSVEHF